MGVVGDAVVDPVGVGVGDAVVDPALRDRLVSVWMESEILRVLRLRTVSAVLAGRSPGAEASVRKAIADAHGQHVMGLGRDLAGANGMLRGTAPVAAARPGPRPPGPRPCPCVPAGPPGPPPTPRGPAASCSPRR